MMWGGGDMKRVMMENAEDEGKGDDEGRVMIRAS